MGHEMRHAPPRRSAARELLVANRCFACWPSARMSSVRTPSPLVLLVARDDEDRAALLGALWQAGFDVECAASAAECIRLVLSRPPAIIVIHRLLRDGDGWDLVRVIRSLSSTENVPLVAIAENGSSRLIERAFAVGCDVVLAQPFQPGAMVRQMRRVLLNQTATREVDS